MNVERRSVDRPVSEGDKNKEASIEITEIKEEPVIGKQERVVEEIVVGKTAEEHTEPCETRYAERMSKSREPTTQNLKRYAAQLNLY